MDAMILPSELPIIQAPMAGGPSTPQLTAAVARAGGFGFLAAGYLSPDQLVDLIDATRAISQVPFGVNIFCPTDPAERDVVRRFAQVIRPESERLGVSLGEARWDDDAFDDKIGVVESRHIDLVSFTFGCPDPLTIERLHSAGSRVAVTVTSLIEALHAERAGADLLLVQGTEAGGHQGTFLGHGPNVTPLLSLLDEIVAPRIGRWSGSGGIITGAESVEVLRRGAIGVQLGTAYLCCPESGTSAVYRRALLDRLYADTVLTRAFSGRYARGLANEFALAYGNVAPAAYPEIHHLTRPLRAAATAAGDPSTPNFWAGQGWRRVSTDSAERGHPSDRCGNTGVREIR